MSGGKIPHKNVDTKLVVSGSLNSSDALSLGKEPVEPIE
jgi:hypothetical protein